MHWNSFKEKAQKVNKKFYFKRTKDGYEVWDKALLYGPGFPRKYKIMVIPFGTNALGFTIYLKKLKVGEWNRRRNMQFDLTQAALANNNKLKDAKRERFSIAAKEAAKTMRRITARVKSDLGISSMSVRMGMKGIMFDDTKKALRKELEQRGAFK